MIDVFEVVLSDGAYYYLWEENNIVKGSLQNPNVHVINLNKVTNFEDFTFDEAIEYVKRCF